MMLKQFMPDQISMILGLIIYFIEFSKSSNLTKSSQSTSLKEMFKLFANNIFCMHIKCGLPKQKAVKFLL